MNVVKFQDIILTPETSGFTPQECDLFNSEFKAKYAYVVNWKWVVPFSSLSRQEYIAASEEDRLPSGVVSMNMTELWQFTDITATGRANNIGKFVEMNAFAPSSDVTIADLKRFRTRVAEWVLMFRTNEDSESRPEASDIRMLEYYKGGMEDEATARLQLFIPYASAITSIPSQNTCPCHQNNTTTDNTAASLCDPDDIYRRGIYNVMVSYFSNPEYWLDTDADMLTMMKLYVDNIIKADFKLTTSEYDNDLIACGCGLEEGSQAYLMAILRDLSKALQYMINELNDIDTKDRYRGNRNFVAGALNKWASKLYENMEWA